MRPGDWRGASGTVHQNSFDMVPLAGSSMCGRDSMLVHGGDCSADPSRVRSARNNAAFAATILHFFVVCSSSYRLFRAALSSRMKCVPVSKMAPSWKLCSNKPASVLCCCYFSFAALFCITRTSSLLCYFFGLCIPPFRKGKRNKRRRASSPAAAAALLALPQCLLPPSHAVAAQCCRLRSNSACIGSKWPMPHKMAFQKK